MDERATDTLQCTMTGLDQGQSFSASHANVRFCKKLMSACERSSSTLIAKTCDDGQ